MVLQLFQRHVVGVPRDIFTRFLAVDTDPGRIIVSRTEIFIFGQLVVVQQSPLIVDVTIV
jgi:hypothetical protein